LKFNFKLCGQNHKVDIRGDLGIKVNTIVVGADVTHPQTGLDLGCPSMAGLVASYGDLDGKPDSGGDYHRYLASARL
jgi:eukaryotic translation initiation factor 2C